MALDNHERLALHPGLVDGLGRETADRLMAELPQVDWADVATKEDLRSLEERLDRRFDRIDHRFELMEQRFQMIDPMIDGKLGKYTTKMFFAVAGLLLGSSSITAAALFTALNVTH